MFSFVSIFNFQFSFWGSSSFDLALRKSAVPCEAIDLIFFCLKVNIYKKIFSNMNLSHNYFRNVETEEIDWNNINGKFIECL